jgi:signal recognition particle receptor subunit beta
MQTVKMVVTGPFNAGKTEFIRSVSEIEVVSTERKISSESERVKDQTTVAMDIRHARAAQVRLYVGDPLRRDAGFYRHGG